MCGLQCLIQLFHFSLKQVFKIGNFKPHYIQNTESYNHFPGESCICRSWNLNRNVIQNPLYFLTFYAIQIYIFLYIPQEIEYIQVLSIICRIELNWIFPTYTKIFKRKAVCSLRRMMTRLLSNKISWETKSSLKIFSPGTFIFFFLSSLLLLFGRRSQVKFGA